MMNVQNVPPVKKAVKRDSDKCSRCRHNRFEHTWIHLQPHGYGRVEETNELGRCKKNRIDNKGYVCHCDCLVFVEPKPEDEKQAQTNCCCGHRRDLHLDWELRCGQCGCSKFLARGKEGIAIRHFEELADEIARLTLD